MQKLKWLLAIGFILALGACAPTMSKFSGGNMQSSGYSSAEGQTMARIAQRVSEEVVFKGQSLELIAPDFVYHPFFGPDMNREATLGFWATFPKSFSDTKITWNHVLVDGDKVALYFTMSGKQTGEFQGLPASGKSATWKGAVIRRIKNGQVVEEWDVVDMAGLMGQLTAK